MMLHTGNERFVGLSSATPSRASVLNSPVRQVSLIADRSASTNVDEYGDVEVAVLEGLLCGESGCIVCYEPTGSGKPYSLCGKGDSEVHAGVLLRCASQVFAASRSASRVAALTLYAVELYLDELRDVLSVSDGARWCSRVSAGHTKSLLFPSGDASALAPVAFRDVATVTELCSSLTSRAITSHHDLMQVHDCIVAVRAPGASSLVNRASRASRSHTLIIFQLDVVLSHEQRCTTESAVGVGGPQRAYLTLVDLAGAAESAAALSPAGSGALEAQSISKSLYALGGVVTALTQGATCIPYRDSRLTRLLWPVFQCSRTVVLVDVPAVGQRSETLTILSFAQQGAAAPQLPSDRAEELRAAEPVLRAKEQLMQLAADLCIVSAAFGHLPRRLGLLPRHVLKRDWAMWYRWWQGTSAERDDGDAQTVLRDTIVEGASRGLRQHEFEARNKLHLECQALCEGDVSGEEAQWIRACDTESRHLLRLRCEKDVLLRCRLLLCERLSLADEQASLLLQRQPPQNHPHRSGMAECSMERASTGAFHPPERCFSSQAGCLDEEANLLQRDARNQCIVRGLQQDQLRQVQRRLELVTLRVENSRLLNKLRVVVKHMEDATSTPDDVRPWSVRRSSVEKTMVSRSSGPGTVGVPTCRLPTSPAMWWPRPLLAVREPCAHGFCEASYVDAELRFHVAADRLRRGVRLRLWRPSGHAGDGTLQLRRLASGERYLLFQPESAEATLMNGVDGNDSLLTWNLGSAAPSFDRAEVLLVPLSARSHVMRLVGPNELRWHLNFSSPTDLEALAFYLLGVMVHSSSTASPFAVDLRAISSDEAGRAAYSGARNFATRLDDDAVTADTAADLTLEAVLASPHPNDTTLSDARCNYNPVGLNIFVLRRLVPSLRHRGW